MTQKMDWTPNEVERQRGRKRWEAGYEGKEVLIRAYARHLKECGEVVTYAKIQAMLIDMERGSNTKPNEIYTALRELYARGELDRWPNGRRVLVNGTWYQSIREAATAERCRQSTVKKRIESGEPGWFYGD